MEKHSFYGQFENRVRFVWEEIGISGGECGILISDKLLSFLEYLRTHVPTDDFTSRIEQRVDAAKSKREWRSDYMTLQEHYDIERAEGLAEGLAKGRTEGRDNALVDVIRNMSQNLDYSVEDACRAVGITIDEYNRIKDDVV